MEKNKIPKVKENKTKVVTIRMAPSVHSVLLEKAKLKKKSLSKYLTDAALLSK